MTTYRHCGSAACDFRTEVDTTTELSTDAAHDTVTDHYQTDHGMTAPEAGYFGSHHSTTTTEA